MPYELQLGSDWLGLWGIFFLFNNFFFCLVWILGYFHSVNLVIDNVDLFCEAPSYQFSSIWLNQGGNYNQIHLRIHLATSICSRITNKHQWSSSARSRTCLCDKAAKPWSLLQILNEFACLLLNLSLTFLCSQPNSSAVCLKELSTGPLPPHHI